MQLKNIFISLDIIEATIRKNEFPDLDFCNKLISGEIKKILLLTNDVLAEELIFGVYFGWKYYSGQINAGTYRLNHHEELEKIFADCQRIRTYLINKSQE
jgi:hypothetical protein